MSAGYHKLRRELRLPKTLAPPFHDTAGLPGFPANDVFAPAGTLVFPPEGGTLIGKHYIPWSKAKRVGGWTTYLQGRSGATYFLTHFANVRRDGRVYPFQSIGRVGEVPESWWASHIHEGKTNVIYTPPPFLT